MSARFAGRCSGCGARVSEGDTIDYDRASRRVLCEACAPAAAPPAPTVVRVSLVGSEVAIRASGRLSDDAFASMRRATVGARFAEGVNYLPIGRAAAAVEELRAAGLTLDVSSEVVAALDALRVATVAAIAGAQGRADAVDAVLTATGAALYRYQREGVAWLAPRSAALVADDMGLGKTIQALTALPAGAATIVVCPAIAKPVWQSEAAKWRPELRVSVCEGKGSLRAPAAGEIVVINPDILAGKIVEGHEGRLEIEAGSIPALLPGTVVIVDEAHAFASSKSQRTLRMRALSQRAREGGGRCWLLTATPLKNRPTDLWNVLQVAGLAREAFGGWKSFVRAFNGREGRYGIEWDRARPSAEVPSMLRRVSIRRRKEDVLTDLPAKTHRTLPAAIDRATAKLCDEALAALGGESGIEAATDKLASSGLGFSELSAARASLARAKIPAMLAVVEQYEGEDEPLVVFSAYRAPIDLLAAREGWASITGDTSPDERGRIVERFQAGELRGVACTIRAGGVAITLTRASNVLRVDREWNPALNVQAEDRCYRIGQRSAVLVTDLVADHALDQRIADVLARKEALIAGSVDAATVTRVAPVLVPELDWSAIEAEAATAMREAEAARVAGAAAANEAARKRAEQQRARAIRNAQERVRVAAAKRLQEETTEADAPRRGPRTAVEAWAIEGLRRLASDDPDRARQLNGIGFSASDGGIGHALAWLPDLTDQEWRMAVRLACHYPAQIGESPAREAA
jgi:SNF2-related domain/Helicase conserved C-terminal domain